MAKHDPYLAKMLFTVERMDTFDKLGFYVRLSAPTGEYADTPIYYQYVNTTKEWEKSDALIDHLFTVCCSYTKEQLRREREKYEGQGLPSLSGMSDAETFPGEQPCPTQIGSRPSISGGGSAGTGRIPTT